MKNYVKQSSIIYLSVIFIFVGLVSFSVFYFFEYSSLSLERIKEITKGGLLVENLKKNRKLERVKENLNVPMERKALEHLNLLLNDLKEIDQLVDSKGKFQILYKDLIRLRNSVNNMAATPKMKNVIHVYQKKMQSFKGFVEFNSWKTLTRLSNRSLARIKGIINRNDFTSKRFRSQMNLVSYDLKTMKSVTEGSVLKTAQKQAIYNKLNVFETEKRIIEKHLNNLGMVKTIWSSAHRSYTQWLDKVSPELSLLLLKMNSEVKNLLILLGLCFFWPVVGSGLAYFISNKLGRKNKIQTHDTILSVLNGHIINGKDIQFPLASTKFIEEFSNLKAYIHKRMNFGGIFQEGVPFPSLLLDSNLNLAWANKIFFDSWNLSHLQHRTEKISWDFLQKFTNLGETGPMIAAVKDDLAGIYQIQVRSNANEDFVPYEMYVSPVKVENEKHILAIFYPLKSLEDTLNKQSKALVGPISQTLERFNSNKVDEEFLGRIRKDFIIGGIQDLFDQFCHLNDKINRDRGNYVEERAKLDGKIHHQKVVISDLAQAIEDIDLDRKRVNDFFGHLKDTLLESEAIKSSLEEKWMVLSKTAKNILIDYQSVNQINHQLSASRSDNEKSFTRMVELKNSFKENMEEIREYKRHLLQSIDQFLIWEKSHEVNQEKTQEFLSLIKGEVKGLDQLFSKLVTTSKDLDKNFAKWQMLLEEKIDASKYEDLNSAENYQEGLDSNQFDYSQEKKKEERLDEIMVERLQDIYQIQGELKDKMAFSYSILDRGMNFVEGPRQTKGIVAVENETMLS